MEYQLVKKPKILCLHGYGYSAASFEKQVEIWPPCVLEKMDLVFIDGPFPVERSEDDTPSSFKWFDSNKDFTEYPNFDEGIAYIEDCMVKLGPFDGVLGFSQGALVTAALPGMQARGVALTKVEDIKFVMVIAGGKLGGFKYSAPKLAENAFSSPIEIPSLHCFGEKDNIAKLPAIELLRSFVDPFVIRHPGGHIVPKLDEEGLKVMLSFLDKIQALPYKFRSPL